MLLLRSALRTLRRSPGVSAVIVLSLALGLGANTVRFQRSANPPSQLPTISS